MAILDFGLFDLKLITLLVIPFSLGMEIENA